MHRATDRRLTGLSSLRPLFRHTIKQGHLGTGNSTRGEQKGEHITKGDSSRLEIGDRSQQKEREKRCSLCLNLDMCKKYCSET
eukprot:scaffold2576_cov136-Isochrysis_galbana.AAC.4